MALRNLGADFEHYRVVEFDKYAIQSYNAIHGTNFSTMDIRDIKGVDLGIEDMTRFTYLLTHSHAQIFHKPGRCVDLQRVAAPDQVYFGR